MLIKEDVLNVVQNIINEPIKRDGGLPKEIRIFKAIEEMEEYRDDVVTCDRCVFRQDGVCSYHDGSVYPDDYCSFAARKKESEETASIDEAITILSKSRTERDKYAVYI